MRDFGRCTAKVAKSCQTVAARWGWLDRAEEVYDMMIGFGFFDPEASELSKRTAQLTSDIIAEYGKDDN